MKDWLLVEHKVLRGHDRLLQAEGNVDDWGAGEAICLLYTSPSPRDS